MRGVTEAKTDDREKIYEKTKRHYLIAIVLVTLGLAVAGSVDRATGGVLLLVGWAAGIMGLHRLGRAGSRPRD